MLSRFKAAGTCFESHCWFDHLASGFLILVICQSLYCSLSFHHGLSVNFCISRYPLLFLSDCFLIAYIQQLAWGISCPCFSESTFHIRTAGQAWYFTIKSLCLSSPRLVNLSALYILNTAEKLHLINQVCRVIPMETVKELTISGEARHVAITSASVGIRHGLLARQCQNSGLHKIWTCKSSCLLNTSPPWDCPCSLL